MRTNALASVFVFVLACAVCGLASAADEKDAVTVVYRNGDKVELKALDVGTESSGLFGTSFKSLKKLPVKTDKMHLEVPLDKLSKIEFLAAEKDAKAIRLKLTAVDGKVLECTVDSESPLVWRGIGLFADAEATVDPATVKEIILRPEKK